MCRLSPISNSLVEQLCQKISAFFVKITKLHHFTPLLTTFIHILWKTCRWPPLFIPLHTVLVHFLSPFPLSFLLLFFKWELFLFKSTLILPVIISAYLNVSSSYTTLIYLSQYFYSLFLFMWEISLFSSLMNILYHILFILFVYFLKVF